MAKKEQNLTEEDKKKKIEEAVELIQSLGFSITQGGDKDSAKEESSEDGDNANLDIVGTNAGEIPYINNAHYGMRVKLDKKYRLTHARLQGNTMFPLSMYLAEIHMDAVSIDPNNTDTLDSIWADDFMQLTQSINGEGMKHDVELLKAAASRDMMEGSGDIFKGG